MEQIVEYSIEIFNISKIYKLKGKKKAIEALNNVNLKIKNREIFGLLGPNGAGKTTLVSILTTLIQPTSGTASILSHDILKDSWFIRENVGLMFGGDMIYNRLTGYRNLKFFCKLYGIKDYKKKIRDLAKKFELTDWLDQYVEKYSKGMKLKLALARVLLIEPKILFLDEPMLGLDPKTTKEVIEILKELKTTIFLTSHQMDIVSRLCDRIAFLREGNIVKVDTQENFKKLISEKIKIQLEVTEKRNDLLNLLDKNEFISGIKTNFDKIEFFIDKNNRFPELLNILKDFPIIHLNEINPTLDDVFIELSK